MWDLAEAHVAALSQFDALPGPMTVINLGTGMGTTVRELLAAFNRVADRPVQWREAAGDPVTSSAPIPGSLERSGCWAGGRNIALPKVYAMLCNGLGSATK